MNIHEGNALRPVCRAMALQTAAFAHHHRLLPSLLGRGRRSDSGIFLLFVLCGQVDSGTEVDLVQSTAGQFGISPGETAKLAHEVRRGRMKVRKPKSLAGRRLLFHLALRVAFADGRVESPERSAIDKLASDLNIYEGILERERQELLARRSDKND